MPKESIVGYYVCGENGDQRVIESSRKALISVINSVSLSMQVELETVDVEDSEIPEILKDKSPDEIKALRIKEDTPEKVIEEFSRLAFEAWQPVKEVLLKTGSPSQEVHDFILPPES